MNSQQNVFLSEESNKTTVDSSQSSLEVEKTKYEVRKKGARRSSTPRFGKNQKKIEQVDFASVSVCLLNEAKN